MAYKAGAGLKLSGTTFSVAVPLSLSGSNDNSILSATNSDSNGKAVVGSNTGSGVGVDGTSATGGGVIGYSGSNINTISGNPNSSMPAGVEGDTVLGSIGKLGISLEEYDPDEDDYFPAPVGVYGYGGGWAGYFDGFVDVTGSLYVDGALFVSGQKDFRIDNPSDPENKYLQHACIETDEPSNVYTGNVVTDGSGSAVVKLPYYVAAINKDFRYQLTVIGQFAQAIIGSEIENDQFQIRTDKPNVKVSWQVTGLRNDKYQQAHPFQVEPDKPATERGTYLDPADWGQPLSKGKDYQLRQDLHRSARATTQTP